jgi:hypothetical protein
MKEYTARTTLNLGSRVSWDHDKTKGGTVIEKGPQRVAVKWDDPSEGEISYLFYTEMANIGILPANRPVKPEDVTNLSRSEVGI